MTSAPSDSGMMQAVVFNGPYKVAVEQRPIPKVQNPEDIVVKVGYTALCGRWALYLSCKKGHYR